MTPQLLILLTIAAAASAFPSSIYGFKTDYMNIEQKGTPGKSVEGEYSWVAPNGREIFVKYIADKRGFRVIDSKNNFNDFDFDRSSSSSAGEEDNFSVQEISPVKATHRKPAVAPRSENFRSFSPAAAPVAAPKTSPLTAPKRAPVAAPKTAPLAAPKTAQLTAPKTTPVASPVATRAAKTVSEIESMAEEKKESAPAPATGSVKKSDDLKAAAVAKGPVEIEATTLVAAKEGAPAEGEEGSEGGAEEGGEEGAEAEEGAEVEEAEMEEEGAEAEEAEMEEV